MIEGEPNFEEEIQETPEQQATSKALKKIAEDSEPVVETPTQLQEFVVEKAEQLGVPILNERDIDEQLGDQPYATHTIVSSQENIKKILNARKLQSSRELGEGSMTYESDKLIGMDDNVFFALGKGYMRRDTYSLVFDPEILAEIPDASFVEDDLDRFAEKVINNFLEENSERITKTIDQNRSLLEASFKKSIEHAFGGGHGIYEEYFGENARDRIQDFLDAIESKGFEEIANEEKAVDQFRILSDTVLSQDIMPPDLRDKLKEILEREVIDQHTITGEKNIQNSTKQCWESDTEMHKSFLEDGRFVPEKIVEIRIPNEVDISKAIIGIYVPTIKNT